MSRPASIQSVVQPMAFKVDAMLSPAGSAVGIRFDLMHAPSGLTLMIARDTAEQMIQDLQMAVAVIDQADHGKADA